MLDEWRLPIAHEAIERGADVRQGLLLFDAVRANAVPSVRMLLAAGVTASVAHGPAPHRRPLLHAARSGDAVAVLLAAGAPVDARDAFGWTPLHRAMAARRVSVVRALLHGGADFGALNAHGRTPLAEAQAVCTPAELRRTLQSEIELGWTLSARRRTVARLIALAPLNLSVLEALAVVSFSLSQAEQQFAPSEFWQWKVAVLVQKYFYRYNCVEETEENEENEVDETEDSKKVEESKEAKKVEREKKRND